LNPSFEYLVDEIDSEYARLGHKMGWRFLTVPRRTLEARPEIALITLNPGGSGIDATQGRESCEYGCAYRTEAWGSAPGKSALQIQVSRLMEEIRIRLRADISLSNFMDDHVLSGYFIPFRSPSYSELVHPQASVAFAGHLWSEVFANWMPKLIVTIDNYGFSGLQSIVKKRLATNVDSFRSFDTGWGRVKARVAKFKSPDGISVAILGLPHLSTYKLFAESGRFMPAVRLILDHAVDR
jgi:hypothetical protein